MASFRRAGAVRHNAFDGRTTTIADAKGVRDLADLDDHEAAAAQHNDIGQIERLALER